MSFSLVPQYIFRSYTDITTGFLKKLGIRFLMLDLDNTIAKYSEKAPSAAAIKWTQEMTRNNISLFIVSNSRRKDRVDIFAKALGIKYIKAARKPSPSSVKDSMRAEKYYSYESALLGDQIYTDILAANRAGVISIIVRPLSLRNPLLLLRYVSELPFRAIGKIKNSEYGKVKHRDE